MARLILELFRIKFDPATEMTLAERAQGAEIGIFTQKLHARGPMGLPEMTSTKYVVTGDGHVR